MASMSDTGQCGVAMRSRCLFLASFLLAAGCTASSPDEAASAADLATAPPLSPHDAHVHDIAVADQSPRLEAMFGQFASGRSAVYRGTFAAKDNASVLGNEIDGVFPEGPAVASIIPNRDGLGGVTLGVVGTPSRQHVELWQTGDTTWISLVNAPTTSGGLISSCERCFLDLNQHPASLGFAEVVARGEYGTAPPKVSEVTVSGNFNRVPPGQLRFDDIRDLQLLGAELVADGPDMVATAKSRSRDDLPSAGPNAWPCYLATDYAIDMWVARDDIGQHGLRNFRTLGSQTCCTFQETGFDICRPLVRTKNIATGVGNTAVVAIADELSGAKDVVRKIRLDYDDTHAYFHHDAHAHAVVIVHTSTIDGETTQKLTADLTLSGTTYGGAVKLDRASLITAIEVAFSDAAGATWDSNLSRNYRVEL